MRTFSSISAICVFLISLSSSNGAGDMLGERFPSEDAKAHRMTVKVTITRQGADVISVKNGITTKTRSAIVERVSNKTLLDVFVADTLIPDVKGWEIVMISERGVPSGFFLQKKGEGMIDVSSYFELVVDFAEEKRSFRGQFRAFPADDINIDSGRFASKSRGSVDFTFGSNNQTIGLEGIANYTGSLETVTDGDREEVIRSSVTLDTLSITTGSGIRAEDTALIDNNFVGVVEGSYTFAKGIPVSSSP